MTPSRAFLTMGVSVFIFMPGPAGMAQDACGLGLFSTCQGGDCSLRTPYEWHRIHTNSFLPCM